MAKVWEISLISVVGRTREAGQSTGGKSLRHFVIGQKNLALKSSA
jgi:hypothetical protein